MAVEILGAGTAHRKQIRGRLWHAQETPASWGLEEVKTPHYFICTISDATLADVQIYLETADEEAGLTYSGVRFIMSAPEIVNANGKTYTLAEFDAVMVDQS